MAVLVGCARLLLLPAISSHLPSLSTGDYGVLALAHLNLSFRGSAMRAAAHSFISYLSARYASKPMACIGANLASNPLA